MTNPSFSTLRRVPSLLAVAVTVFLLGALAPISVAQSQLSASGKPLPAPPIPTSPANPALDSATSAMLAPVPFSPGDVFVGVGNGVVAHYSSNGVLLADLQTGTGSSEITGMGFDLDGNLYVTCFSVNQAAKFDNSGNLIQSPWGGPFNQHPESITFDDDQNIYIGQADGSGAVLKCNRSGTFLRSFNVARESRGTDWITFGQDGCVLYYTSEGSSVRRFNVCTNAQLPDFASLPTSPAFGLRVRPNGEVLVAASNAVHRLDNAGNVLQSYSASLYGESSFFFALNLDPDNETFWTAGYSGGNVYRIRIADGSLVSSFNAPYLFSVAGLAVYGELAPPNHRPVCDAGGPYQAACTGPSTSLRLDGSGSTDADHDDLSYRWTTSCVGASLDDPTSATPLLTLDTSSGTGITCGVTLEVSDGRTNGTSNCLATVSISGCSQPPVCVVAAPQGANVCEPVSFDASGSYDPAGGDLSYEWDFGDGQTAPAAGATMEFPECPGRGLCKVSHVYGPDTPAGPVSVSLKITNALGATCSRDFVVNVAAPLQEIFGTVRSLAGGPIAGARLQLFGSDGTRRQFYDAVGGRVDELRTLSDGTYSGLVRPGWDYVIACEAADYWPQMATGLTVCAGDGGRRAGFTMIAVPTLKHIVSLDHTGISPGPLGATQMSLTLRPQTTGEFFVKVSLDDRFSVSLAPTNPGLGINSSGPSSLAVEEISGGLSTLHFGPDEWLASFENPDAVVLQGQDAPGVAAASGATSSSTALAACCTRSSCYYITGLQLTKNHIYRLALTVADTDGAPTANAEWVDVELFKRQSGGINACPSAPKGVSQDAHRLPLVVDRPANLEGSEARELLARHQPVFILDSEDGTWPQDVDVLLERVAIRDGVKFINDLTGPRCLADGGCANRGMVGMFLTRAMDKTPELDLYGDEAIVRNPPSTPAWADFGTAGYPSVVYGTAVKVGNKLFLSYWCFFSFEFNALAPLFSHEGDWERVIVVLEDGPGDWRPLEVLYSSHCHKIVRSWADVERVAVNGREVARVYVSREYHGMFPVRIASAPAFCPVAIPPPPATERADGSGRIVWPWDAPRANSGGDMYARPEVLPRFDRITAHHPGRWALFPGDFGRTRIPDTDALEGFKPRSPLFNGDGLWTITDLPIQPGMASSPRLVSATPGQSDSKQPGHAESPEPLRSGGASGAATRILEAYLLPPRPMPLEGDAVIEYGLPSATRVRLEVFDVTGRLAVSLVDRTEEAGRKVFTWRRSTSPGGLPRAGVYLLRLEAGATVRTQRIVVLQ